MHTTRLGETRRMDYNAMLTQAHARTMTLEQAKALLMAIWKGRRVHAN